MYFYEYDSVQKATLLLSPSIAGKKRAIVFLMYKANQISQDDAHLVTTYDYYITMNNSSQPEILPETKVMIYFCCI